MQEELALTLPVACQRLGITRNHALKLIANGELEAFDAALDGSTRVSFRVTVESIDNFKHARRILPGGKSPLKNGTGPKSKARKAKPRPKRVRY